MKRRKFSNATEKLHGGLTGQVLTRDGNKCVWCGEKEDLVVDHIIPVRDGGKSTLDNQRVLCRSCHSKHTNTKPYEELTPSGRVSRKWREEHPNYMNENHKSWISSHPGYDKRKTNRHEIYVLYSQS